MPSFLDIEEYDLFKAMFKIYLFVNIKNDIVSTYVHM